ncbi:electron transfer flavoprotein subunit alpha/FixB family protein [Maribrevibacterium harenarium]|uniref:Electron transfer flavoprotein subunit alpha n=1 Tax=Maribrevibacterium harenarium TaxID=2589817 RepID=A0A501WIA6_9GAMM|nr:FAD-binding protein [Maribrevibacterium harenarium]TPE48100.1 electron transfer flavoprotein subunit alpha/FixB family protein [Maribrevibacterium harenarium]
MKTLVIAEHNQNNIKAATYIALGAAKQLDQPVDILVAGDQVSELAATLANIEGVNGVLTLEDSALAMPFAETLAPVIASLAEQYSHILMASTSFGKDLAPRVAALCGVNPVSDVTKIVSHDTYQRPIYAGNAIATVQLSSACHILTIRSSAFDPWPSTPAANVADISKLDVALTPSPVQFVSQQLSQSERPELGSAQIVVSGGRGLGSGENFNLVYQLADKLGAAVGASRAAVDAGFIANDLQVGQTGQVVAPNLYLAVGISGAIQHLAGMKDSKVIVAINKDEDAPIFSVADYGLVGDLFEILPELTAKL